MFRGLETRTKPESYDDSWLFHVDGFMFGCRRALVTVSTLRPKQNRAHHERALDYTIQTLASTGNLTGIFASDHGQESSEKHPSWSLTACVPVLVGSCPL